MLLHSGIDLLLVLLCREISCSCNAWYLFRINFSLCSHRLFTHPQSVACIHHRFTLKIRARPGMLWLSLLEKLKPALETWRTCWRGRCGLTKVVVCMPFLLPPARWRTNSHVCHLRREAVHPILLWLSSMLTLKLLRSRRGCPGLSISLRRRLLIWRRSAVLLAGIGSVCIGILHVLAASIVFAVLVRHVRFRSEDDHRGPDIHALIRGKST